MKYYSDIHLCIQARMSSSRLPGKVIEDIKGIPLIVYLYKRLEEKFPSLNIVVLTSFEKSDDPLVDILKKNNISYFRDSLNDVLLRFVNYQKALNEDIKFIGRICADSPFLNLDVLEYVMKQKDDNFDIVTTRYYDDKKKLNTTASKGNNFDLLNRKSLKNVYIDNNYLDKNDIEHVIFPFLRKKLKTIDVSRFIKNKIDMAIDTYEDLERLRKIK